MSEENQMNFKQALIAHLQGETVQKRIECTHGWVPFSTGAESATLAQVLDPSFASKCEFRIAPRTIRVNGVEVPAPEKEAPKHDGIYYVPSMEEDCLCTKLFWDGCDFELKYLKLGLVYLNKEDAIARAKAMLIVKEG